MTKGYEYISRNGPSPDPGIAASPASFVWARWLDRLESLGEPEALQIHFMVERWALDEFPLPARLFEDVVEWLYREDRFMRGNLTIAGRIAAPEALTMPLLSVVNPRSVIIPAESSTMPLPAPRSASTAIAQNAALPCSMSVSWWGGMPTGGSGPKSCAG